MTDLVDRIYFENSSPVWVFILRFTLAVIVAAFYFAASLHFAYTPDDTYIYLQYARNIAQGDGFAFNAGTPSYGVTGPFWALFVAIGPAIRLDPYIVAKTFDLIFASLSVLLAHLVTFLLTRDRIYALAGALLVAADAWLLRWAGSGMEASLATFLLLMTVRFIVSREFALAAFGSSVLVLVRPEGVIVLSLVCVQGFLDARSAPSPWSYRVRLMAFMAAPVVSWLVLAYSQFGTIIPNTFAAKTGQGFIFEDSLASVFQSGAVIGSSQLISLLLLVVTLASIAKHIGWKYLLREGTPALLPFLLTAAFGILAANVVSRYIVPFLPLVPIYALWGLKHMEIHRQWSWRRTVVVLALISAIAAGQNIFVYTTRVLPHLSNFSRGMEECFKPLGYWLKSQTAADAVVVAHDIGMIGYISERTIFDTPGLITPELRQRRGAISADDVFGIDSLWKFTNADYIVDRSKVPERLKGEQFHPEITRTFLGLGIQTPDTMYFTIYRVGK